MTKLTIFNMHILQALSKMQNNSVDIIITSPPYWNLRRYPEADAIWGGKKNCDHEWGEETISKQRGAAQGATAIVGNQVAGVQGTEIRHGNTCAKCGAWFGQLGNEESVSAYLNHLMLITSELKRIMKPTATMWWNMNDTYASGGGKATEQSYNRESGNETGQPDNPAKAKLRSTLGKSKLLIPELFAVKMVYERGFILRNSVCWRKPSAMPTSATDRLNNVYEPVYFFVKDKNYYFSLDSIRSRKTYPNAHVKELCEEIYVKAKEMRNQNKLLSYNGKVKAQNAEMMSSPRARELRPGGGSLQEFLVAVRVIAKQVKEEHPELTEKEKEYIDWFQHNQSGNILGSNPGDIWDINTEPLTANHTAAFPKALVKKCLLAGCPNGGIVFDPFMGSGTVGEVAIEMGLDCIGVEISPSYCGIIEKRCKTRERGQLGQLDYQLIEEEAKA